MLQLLGLQVKIEGMSSNGKYIQTHTPFCCCDSELINNAFVLQGLWKVGGREQMRKEGDSILEKSQIINNSGYRKVSNPQSKTSLRPDKVCD